MIKTIEIDEIVTVQKTIPFEEFLSVYAKFTLFDILSDYWIKEYELPKGKRVIYIYDEKYDTRTGESYESEIGFLVLELEEYIIDDYFKLREFCIDNIARIIPAEPGER